MCDIFAKSTTQAIEIKGGILTELTCHKNNGTIFTRAHSPTYQVRNPCKKKGYAWKEGKAPLDHPEI